MTCRLIWRDLPERAPWTPSARPSRPSVTARIASRAWPWPWS